MSDDVRLAIVGAGRIAGDYVAAVAQTEGVVLAAVVDVDGAAAQKLAAAGGLGGGGAYTSVEAMLDASDVDAALVSTPPATHAPICAQLMAAGVAVLCEKPLCVTSDDAEALVDAAERAGVTFGMATKFRFVDDVVKARELIDAGRIGDVLLYENAFTGHVDMSGRWNSDPALAGGGVLMDNGTHSVDLIRHFLGPITRVHALAGPRVQDIAVEDSVQVFCRTAGRAGAPASSSAVGAGAMCSVDLSWSFNKALPTYVSIYGTTGAIRLGWQSSEIRDDATGAWTAFGTGYRKVEAFSNQLRDFAGAVRGEHATRVSTADALASVRVIEAAYASMRGVRESGWVEVADAAMA